MASLQSAGSVPAGDASPSRISWDQGTARLLEQWESVARCRHPRGSGSHMPVSPTISSIAMVRRLRPCHRDTTFQRSIAATLRGAGRARDHVAAITVAVA